MRQKQGVRQKEYVYCSSSVHRSLFSAHWSHRWPHFIRNSQQTILNWMRNVGKHLTKGKQRNVFRSKEGRQEGKWFNAKQLTFGEQWATFLFSVPNLYEAYAHIALILSIPGTPTFRIGWQKCFCTISVRKYSQFAQVFEDNRQFLPMLWNDMTWRPYRLSSTFNRRPNESDNA